MGDKKMKTMILNADDTSLIVDVSLEELEQIVSPSWGLMGQCSTSIDGLMLCYDDAFGAFETEEDFSKKSNHKASLMAGRTRCGACAVVRLKNNSQDIDNDECEYADITEDDINNIMGL